ncbi:hypothetical protein [Rhodococcus opacus]|uniref:hypothetical protein n=1 Tax=Rhodococcus opacus TaxID=37919 RepID=UPI000AACF7CB|nr:hypothetical protein [Rhodococcus opacus]
MFRDLLDAEIAALTAQIESTRGHAGHTQDGELGAGLRGQFAEAHQLVAGLIARYPDLAPSDRPGTDQRPGSAAAVRRRRRDHSQVQRGHARGQPDLRRR